MAIFDPPQNPHPLTDHQKIWYRWLRQRPLWQRQMWCKSVDGASGQMGEIFIYLFIPFFHQLTYRSDPSTDFHAWWLKRRWLAQGCAFWRWHCSPFWGWNPPKTPILGAWIGVFKPKVSCYRNYCIDFNHILHNDRHRQVIVVGGPNSRPTNPRWRTAAILKTVKSSYLCNRLSDFYEILAQWRILAPYSGSTVKIVKFWKVKMAAAAILKITKIAISPQRFDRSLRNLVRWCKVGLLTSPTLKNFEFRKSKMADGSHFKNR